jgi:hypothetical protein
MESPDIATDTVRENSHASFSMAGSPPAKLPPSRRVQWAQASVLVALYAASAILCLRIASVSDPDVWSHIRTGEWIVQHGGVPHTDPFSSFGAGKPWAAYSWLYELLIFQLFQRLGLVGIVAYTTGMAVAVTVFLHRLIRRLQADFTFAVLLTAVACSCMTRLDAPRPWWFTIFFFVMELDLLLQARKTGKMRGLLWLPVIFALWANVHIQFIVGLVVLTIALAESVLARRWTVIQTRMRAGWMCGIFIACILAAMVNPYGWTIYRVAYEVASQPGILNKVTEYMALPFRSLDDWLLLLLLVAAVAVLARVRRVALFEILLLAFAVVVTFRSQRDLWVGVIAASAILAAELTGDDKNRFQLTAYVGPFVAVTTALIVSLGILFLHVNNARLGTDLARGMPVRAVEVVKEKGWSGPLYNDYTWGGYLIWALRMPVGIDGRTNVHGDERIYRWDDTWNGRPEWASDPDLQKAGLVIGPVKASLTQLLRMDPRFELAYEDKLTAVFVARRSLPSGAAESPAAAGSMATHAAVK